MLGSAFVFSGAGWHITSFVFVRIVLQKFSQASENLSMLCCMSAYQAVLSTQSSSNKKSLTVSDVTLVFT